MTTLLPKHVKTRQERREQRRKRVMKVSGTKARSLARLLGKPQPHRWER